MKLLTKYNNPTPARARKVGKAIQHLGTSFQVVLAALQGGAYVLDKNHYILLVLMIAGLQWLGETVTDLWTEDENGSEVPPAGN